MPISEEDLRSALALQNQRREEIRTRRTQQEQVTPVQETGGGGFFGALGRLGGLGADAFRAVTPQGVRDVGGAVLRAADRPISDRFGFHIPDDPLFFDEIGNVVLEEATRPTNIGLAVASLLTGGTAGAGAAAARGGVRGFTGRAVGGAGRVLLAPAGGNTALERVIAETAINVGGRGGFEAADKAADAVDAPAPVRLVLGLAGAAVGGGAALSTTRSSLRGIIGDDILAPPIVARNGMIKLRPTDSTDVPLKGGLLFPTAIDFDSASSELLTPDNIIKHSEELHGIATSLRNGWRDIAEGRLGSLGGRIKQIDNPYVPGKKVWIVEDTNIRTRVTRELPDGSLDRNVYLQDLIAFDQTHYDNLTDEQLQAIAAFRTPHAEIQNEAVIFGQEPQLTDLTTGQHYAARLSDAEVEESLNLKPSEALNKSVEHERVFPTEMQGIQAGFEYAHPLDALDASLNRKLNAIINKYTADQMRKFGIDPVKDPHVIKAQKRVARFSSAMAAVQKKIVRLTGEAKAADRFATQSRRAESNIGGRLETAARKLADNPNDPALKEGLRILQGEVTDAIDEVVSSADRIGRAFGRLDEAQRVTIPAEFRRIAAEATATKEEMADVLTYLAGSLPEYKVKRAEATLRRLDNTFKKLDDAAVRIEEFEDGLIATGKLRQGESAARRSELVAARRRVRQFRSLEKQAALGEQKFKLYEAELKRQGKLTETVETFAERAKMKATSAKTEYERLRARRDEARLSLAAAKDRAAIGERTAVRIPNDVSELLAGVQFPQDVAKSIFEHFGKGRKKPGAVEGVLRKIRGFNQRIIPLRAAGDMSALLNQLATVLPSHPKIWTKNMYRAFHDAYNLDDYAAWLETDDAQHAIRHGIVALGSTGQQKSDFIAGWFDRIPLVESRNKKGLQRGLPGFSQGQNHFRAVTTRNRVDIFNSLVDTTQRETGQALTAAQKRQIARGVNRITGIATSTATDFETLTEFAPNFLRSGIETIHAAFTKGNLEGQLARQYLTNMVVAGQTAAVFAAVSTGRDVKEVLNPLDPKALANGELRINGNFGTIRIPGADIDVNLYGRWDSLARLATLTVDATTRSIAEWDAMQLFDAIGYIARTKGAPGTTLTGDLIQGNTFTGDAPLSVSNLTNFILPFSASGLKDDLLASENLGVSAFDSAFNFLGAKANPVTPFEQLSKAAMQRYGRKYDDLTGTEKEALRTDFPKIAQRMDAQNERKAAAGDPRARLRIEREEINALRLEQEQQLANQWIAGTIGANELNRALSALSSEAYFKGQEAAKVLGVEYTSRTPEDEALDRWYALTDEATVAPGVVDWDLRDGLESSLFDAINAGQFGDPERAMALITDRKRTDHVPDLQEFFAAKDYLQQAGYWRIQDKQFQRVQATASRMAGTPLYSYGSLEIAIRRANDPQTQERLKRLKGRIDSAVRRSRQLLRLRDQNLDDAIVLVYDAVPIRQQQRSSAGNGLSSNIATLAAP